MDELTIDGKIYVSSKRAAAITGYAKDYIGQLCREGRVEAKLVGRSWYVYEPSLKKHRFSNEEETEQPKAVTAWGGTEASSAENTEEPSEKPNIQAAWDVPTYVPEEVTPLPELEAEAAAPEPVPFPETVTESVHDETVEPLSDMQSAWQEWFSTRNDTGAEEAAAPRPTPSIVRVPEHPPEAWSPQRSEPQNVPLRTIVSDIAPIHRAEEPVRPVYASSYESARPVAITRQKARKHRSGSTYAYRTVMQAALIAIMAISASVALVSTGIIDSLHLGGSADIGLIRFLEGSSVVEK